MKILVAEDDFASRRILLKLLAPYGEADGVVDGTECLEAFKLALDEGAPYKLVFLDIVMPGKSGHDTLLELRALERERGIKPRDEAKVLMTSVLEDPHNVIKAYNEGGATSYLVKPIAKEKLEAELRKLDL